MDNRAGLARRFLEDTGWGAARMRPLAGDASARRYFRLTGGDGQSAVLMDAPPGDGVDITPFLSVARYLLALGLSAPKVVAADVAAGFILMEDLGDALFARQVQAKPELEQGLYEAAVDVLAVLDSAPLPDFVPVFSVSMMCEQIAPVYDWYRRGLADDVGEMQKRDFQALLETVMSKVTPDKSGVLLRDFHAENLIWLPDRTGVAQVGLLDFQDAMIGPQGYDLVSLLLDARRDVSPGVAQAMIARFVHATGRDPEAFAATYAALGAQRNLRILGVFARLCMLHGKVRYVDFIPRVWGYVQDCLAHPALADLARMVQDDLPSPSPANLQKLKARCAPLQTP